MTVTIHNDVVYESDALEIRNEVSRAVGGVKMKENEAAYRAVGGVEMRENEAYRAAGGISNALEASEAEEPNYEYIQ